MDIFVAPPGYSIVQADQSGAEALIVANIAPRKGALYELFSVGIKPHTYMAMRLFPEELDTAGILDLAPTELTKLPDWKAINKRVKNSGKPYDIGKRVVHASNYRMGPNTFRTSALVQSGGKLVLTRDQCIDYLQTFKHTFPEVIEWQDEIEIEINRRRVLRNLFNHPRRFNRIITPGYIREGISFIPQSTVGEITRRTFVLLQDVIDKDFPRWSICSDKHDSAAVMVPDEDVMTAGRLLKSLMRVTLPGRFGDFVMNSEVQAGKNWQPFSEHNPAGMKEIEV
jgi:DNA polymerase I-like protein with 3'-5' exonuclease and polymerase domains